MTGPTATLHPLHRATGSATYISSISTILSSVSYPLEVPRRSDELPLLLLIDVNVRPHNGVGGVKERHLEELVRKTLDAVVSREDYPRQLCQVGLQVMRVEEDAERSGGTRSGGGQGESYLEVLPGLLNAAMLGCLDAGVPMRSVFVAVLVGIERDGRVVVEPGLQMQKSSKSLHVFCFTGKGDMVLCESEGRFDIGDWVRGHERARLVCLGIERGRDRNRPDVEMGREDAGENLLSLLRSTLAKRIEKNERWQAA